MEKTNTPDYDVYSAGNDLLTQEDIVAVTGGAVQQAAQIRYLLKAKIYHWVGKDGQVQTCWYHVHHPTIRLDTKARPDFSHL